ncbi:MAG: type B 50S ribosomal protein L31 [Chloroflexi bacterium]|nr:type B 50S ribosomal protein L31 [Chloroflexota bacterium]
MRAEIHPEYHPVVFVDISTGVEFLTRSTMTSQERREVDGVEAYVVRVEISSSSHPYFTGEHRIVDTAGQVERFRRRYARSQPAADGTAEPAAGDA